MLLVAGPEELEDEQWGLHPFDVAATVRSIRDALGEIPADVLASVEGAVGPPTLNNLCERLTAGAPPGRYSLLHIVCHGAYHEATGETLLYFPQDEGLRPVPATELIERLGRLWRLPHFTFLSTCESADPEAESGLGGLGQRLVRDLGMPAVVAMTGRISVDTAGALAAAFYARLRASGEVDCALSEALAGLQGRDDVTVPALFSRLGGRALFSDALDRPLTEAEIAYGLAQMRVLIEQRAPVLLPEAERHAATVQSTLGTDAASLSSRARREREAALAAASQLRSQALDLSFNALALGQPPPAYDGRCPFRGLFPFRTEDREFFFGRQAMVNKVSGRLMAHGFLAVLGSSGCGKSSLVLAGMVPALQARFPQLRVAYLTPGSEPLAQLEAALSDDGGGDGKPNLVIVDQFEELFTLCRHESERQAFVDRLLAQSAGKALVLTLRADFWGECAAYVALKDEMQAHQELVAPMDTAALRRAMERQADHVGLRFEAGLGEAILDDVEGEPGAMPLLQHALLLLWQRRHGRWLRWEEYRAVGGIQQARAEEQAAGAMRMRRRAVAIGVVGIVALVLAVIAVGAMRQAQTSEATANAESTRAVGNEATANAESTRAVGNAEIARAGELAALALGQVEKHLDLALLLGIEAFQRKDLRQTRQTLFEAWSHTPQLSRFLHGHTGMVSSVAWSKDGGLASGSWDNTVIIWDLERGRPAQTLEGHASPVSSVAWSADGRLASVACEGISEADSYCEIIIWDLGLGQPAQTLSGRSSGVESVAWSVDEREASSSGNTVIVSDLEHGRPAQTLSGHSGYVWNVAWSADGRLASGSWDNTVIIWDLERGLPVYTLKGHSDWVKSVAWSAGGQRLASGSSDQTVQVWDTDPKEWIRQACERAGRNLTQGEWVLYFADDETYHTYQRTCEQWPDGP